MPVHITDANACRYFLTRTSEGFFGFNVEGALAHFTIAVSVAVGI